MMKTQLFCVPYAGGTTDLYNELEAYLSEDIELVRIEYAGHGKRLEEPFYDSFQDMVSDAKRMIMERMDPTSENAFLGYSMGSLVVYEVLRQWEQTDVSHVFLSAHKPPHLRNAAQRYALASNDNGDIKSWLMEFGGIDDRLKHSRIFWEIMN